MTIDEEQDQEYHALSDLLIEQYHGWITWDRIEEMEEKALKILEMGLSLAAWKALSAEQQAEVLKRL